MGDLRIGIVGAAGRMGRRLVAEVTDSQGFALAGVLERPDSPFAGQDAGALVDAPKDLEILVETDAAAMFARVDVVIDFTAPAVSSRHAGIAADTRTPLVIGTTGLEAAHEALLRAAAKTIPLVWAPNMSQGVNLLFALTEQVARTLDAAYDIEIFEIHHRNKVDAPSGTALGLGRAAATGRGVVLEDVMDAARHGQTGLRETGHIGFAALRGGDVVGDHTVTFAAAGERIELTHKASDRRIYAAGALRAARWLHGRSPGLYSMRDVLGLQVPS